MTHFNHDWDSTTTPAIPLGVGDRFYAQDLNDDFSYLKHLPYEVVLNGRSKGVVIPPTHSYNTGTHSLTLNGGICAFSPDCIVLDEDETFNVPPKTRVTTRYERTALPNTALTIPQDDTTYYIVATPVKRSLLQRSKTLFTQNMWYCRTRYDSTVTLQTTPPTGNQILIGLALNDEYLLLDDKNNQSKLRIRCWCGVTKISNSLVAILQTYYNTTSDTILGGEISISDKTSVEGIDGGNFKECSIDAVVNGGSYDHCNISGVVLSGSFSYCYLSAKVSSGALTTTFFFCNLLNIEDIAVYTAYNSTLAYPNPQQSLGSIKAISCNVSIQQSIVGDVFSSLVDTELHYCTVESPDNAPQISLQNTYKSSFIVWITTGSAPIKLFENAIRKSEIGKIYMVAYSTPEYGEFICDGTAISRTTYADLFSKIGITYGAGDGVNTFNLPDMRECVPVGAGQSTRAILSQSGHSHDVYTLGEFKDDQFQGHRHRCRQQGDPGSTSYWKPTVTQDASGGYGTYVQEPITDEKNGTPRYGTTTHGKQLGVNFIIKY